RREDRRERLRDRVGEDERAAHHRDAEDDRQRGEERADLSPQEALESDPCHRALASCIAASTSAAVDSSRSRTMRPSAMKRIRSASAAAPASWVTMTIVWPQSSTARRMSDSTSFDDRESRLPVGSSAKTTFGFVT